MRNIKYLIALTVYLFLTVFISAQTFGRIQTETKDVQTGQMQAMESFEEDFALENKINPDEYILGPGDELGLNILTSTNVTYPLKVTPTCDLFIPAVGVIQVNGMTLAEAIRSVQQYIHSQAYPGAKVNLVLINVRKFKIQITGAVNRPGFVTVSPMDRLGAIIKKSSGFRQLAREFSIEIIRDDGSKSTVNYLDYMRDGNLNNNPLFKEGDKIFVPFGDVKKEGIVLRGAVQGSGYDIIEPGEVLGSFLQRRVKFSGNADLESVVVTRKIDGDIVYNRIEPQAFSSTKLNIGETIDILWEKGVMVNGFVLTAGGFSFFPGYTAADYISMAGGNTLKGNPKKCLVRHRDGTNEYGLSVEIRRGDVIVVPRTLKDYVLGETSALQIITSLVTIYLTFLATVG